MWRWIDDDLHFAWTIFLTTHSFMPVIDDIPLSFLIQTRPILLLSCHFLGQRALLFWLFTAISSLDVSRNHASRSHLLDACLVPSTRDSRRPLVRGCPTSWSYRGGERASIRRPSANSAGRFVVIDDIGPAAALLTHFASSSVILVVPDGIDSLRNDQTRPLLIGHVRFHRFRRGWKFRGAISREI